MGGGVSSLSFLFGAAQALRGGWAKLGAWPETALPSVPFLLLAHPPSLV